MKKMSFLLVGLIAICGCQTGSTGGGGGGGDDDEAQEGDLQVTRYDPLPDEPAAGAGAFVIRSRWQRSDLRYYIHNTSPDFDEQTQRDIIAQAFNAWAEVCTLTFQEVTTAAEADMIIGFGAGRHCELYELNPGGECPEEGFDGAGNVLAHCYYPTNGTSGAGVVAGDCHFDEDETWTADVNSRTEVVLLATAIHEIGHGLGLDHEPDDQSAVMYPSYDPSNVKTQLGQDDINGIQDIYGAADGTQPPLEPEQPDVNPTEVPTGAGDPDAALGDSDGDGLDDWTELLFYGTDPNNPDTDGDGLPDSEADYYLDPLNPDTDGDGMTDGEEVLAGGDPWTPDYGYAGTGGETIGQYCAQDSMGSGLVFEVYADFTAAGYLAVQQYGTYPVQVPLYGSLFLDDFGNVGIFLVSADYVYGYIGMFSVDYSMVSGEFETWWTNGTWEGYFGECSFDDGSTDGYYPDGSTDGYWDGSTDGYSDGSTDGYGDGSTDGYWDGSTDGYPDGSTDGLPGGGGSAKQMMKLKRIARTLPRADSSLYQPLPGEQRVPTMAVHQRVNWRAERGYQHGH